jgi:transcriptional regulator with XRE-family HTH domain
MLGEQIKQRRQQEKLTKKELAKLLNTSPANITKWENNQAQPKKEILERLQQLWNVSFNETKELGQITQEQMHNESNNKTNSIEAQCQNITNLETIKSEKKQLFTSDVVDFKELITKNLYYVDKTDYISKIVIWGGLANLITRPRRFGKTLTMSMLKYFFDINGDQSIFKGLKIEKDVEFCKKYMGKYPVISITLKDIVASRPEKFARENYEELRSRLVRLIIDTASQYDFLATSDKLSEYSKQDYQSLLSESMHDVVLTDSLATLAKLLYKHYGKKVVILVDEYDVPLQDASIKKYYKYIVHLMCKFLATTFKFCDELELGVLTGSLLVSQEDIFTVFNNVEMFPVVSSFFDTLIGFTPEEVKAMMKYYNIEQYYNRVKEYYQGYKIWKEDVFCPWDILSYCKQLYIDHDEQPKLYWLNTSNNQMVYDLLGRYGKLVKKDVETFLTGGIIIKELDLFANYKDIDGTVKSYRYDPVESMWSMLLMTGYLTADYTVYVRKYALKIPNYEILDIYQTAFIDYMKKNYSKATELMLKIDEAIAKQEAEDVARLIHKYYLPRVHLIETERYLVKEEFNYQNLLASIFSVQKWIVKRDVELETELCNFIIRIPENKLGIIINFKHAQTVNKETFNNACNESLAQIEEKKYADYFATKYPDYHVIYCGMAFYHQDCQVVFYDPQTKERKESGISGALVSASRKAKAKKTVSAKSNSAKKSTRKSEAKQETESTEAKPTKKSTRKSQAKQETESTEAKPAKKSTRKSEAKQETESTETKPTKKSTRKSEAKKESKSNKKPSSKK